MMIQLQGLLSTITFLDVIDIVVVAYFLYRLFLMLKNTRAATLGKGLMVLIGFTLICRWLNLHVISWLLEKSMTVIMVALPVVFQPELRRALEQIGRGKLFHKGSELDEQELEEMLDSVAHATKVMSKNKVGALMVFERATGLAERIETGVPIDGLVSSGLLQNIFVKDTPLHDGAVVIRGNRVLLPAAAHGKPQFEPGAWYPPSCCYRYVRAVRCDDSCCQRGNRYDFHCPQRRADALSDGG